MSELLKNEQNKKLQIHALTLAFNFPGPVSDKIVKLGLYAFYGHNLFKNKKDLILVQMALSIRAQNHFFWNTMYL